MNKFTIATHGDIVLGAFEGIENTNRIFADAEANGVDITNVWPTTFGLEDLPTMGEIYFWVSNDIHGNIYSGAELSLYEAVLHAARIQKRMSNARCVDFANAMVKKLGTAMMNVDRPTAGCGAPDNGNQDWMVFVTAFPVSQLNTIQKDYATL